MDDPAQATETERREGEVQALRAKISELASELGRRDAEKAALRDHAVQESKLQRAMLASLQSERSALLEEIEVLKSQIHQLGADSARVAVRRAVHMLVRAVTRRLGRR